MKGLGLIATTALFAAGCSTWDGLSASGKRDSHRRRCLELSEVRLLTVRSA